ncbi:MAG: hypothetical protein Q8O29_16845 [Polaromonas sp.]|uniref:hypothetical protein n=1 Tax=Polaromonas sp. TaxID=1869339 RepID=UPI002733BFEB|nr:hypothetical protein [Polaromonas sp.]MDP2819901.1 hypothetical protein [Polaromonas sp.]
MKIALRRAGGIAALLLAAACSKGPDTTAAYPPAGPPSNVKPGFINKVWEVNLSTGVAPGMLYVFLSDGTLVITSPNSKAAFGAWTYKEGVLRMVEESQEYKVDILSLSHDELRLRSNHPKGSVEIMLMPARVAPLPP